MGAFYPLQCGNCTLFRKEGSQVVEERGWHNYDGVCKKTGRKVKSFDNLGCKYFKNDEILN